MPTKRPKHEVKINPASDRIEPLILRVRGQRVILDSDLARLYGVTTSAMNQAVKRNAARFPDDFAFRLSSAETANLRSQFVTSSSQPRAAWGGRRTPPTVFTEHGALMAANLLRSDHAVQMSVYVIRAFIRMREQIAANTAILKRLAEIDQSLLQHDEALRDIYLKLLPLLEPASAPAKRRIGFIRDED